MSCLARASIFERFFFQAEDGIRDGTVTGVQTCALPISSTVAAGCCSGRWSAMAWRRSCSASRRSEERRVGKECRSRWLPQLQKKNVRGSSFCHYDEIQRCKRRRMRREEQSREVGEPLTV